MNFGCAISKKSLFRSILLLMGGLGLIGGLIGGLIRGLVIAYRGRGIFEIFFSVIGFGLVIGLIGGTGSGGIYIYYLVEDELIVLTTGISGRRVFGFILISNINILILSIIFSKKYFTAYKSFIYYNISGFLSSTLDSALYIYYKKIVSYYI